ncbi:nascent polypeptide-associated complex subunit beta, partial [Colletotrichum tofieldiae]
PERGSVGGCPPGFFPPPTTFFANCPGLAQHSSSYSSPTRKTTVLPPKPSKVRASAHHVGRSGTPQEARRLRAYRGKGTPRRKMKRAPARSAADDKKLQAALKKLNVQPIQAIEEVNMFKSDGNVIHFAAPKVHAAVPANTFAIYGNGEDKELTELVPGILNQLGPDSLASLRKLAESYQNMQKEGKDGEEDDIPDLVEGENFESKVE